MRGFSLIELILVLALFTTISVFMFPMSVSLYNKQILTQTQGSLLSSLRSAYHQSITQKNNVPHGVKLLESQYVLFERQTYATREVASDIVVDFIGNTTFTGIGEIVFTEYTGVPSATGTISLSHAQESVSMTVLETGYIK